MVQNINGVIGRNLEISEHFLTLEEASTKFNLSRLPEGAGNEVRIVTIGDYDACPCIGPHVSKTLEIGQFELISTSHENGILRIRFKLSRINS